MRGQALRVDAGRAARLDTRAVASAQTVAPRWPESQHPIAKLGTRETDLPPRKSSFGAMLSTLKPNSSAGSASQSPQLPIQVEARLQPLELRRQVVLDAVVKQ